MTFEMTLESRPIGANNRAEVANAQNVDFNMSELTMYSELILSSEFTFSSEAYFCSRFSLSFCISLFSIPSIFSSIISFLSDFSK